MKKRGKDMKKLSAILGMLARREELPARYRDHQLSGEYKDMRECHVEPDWLLIYAIIENELVLLATETGTHSDLFRK